MRDTYKYWFKIGNAKVHCGITNDLDRRELEHKNSGKYYTDSRGNRISWKKGHIVQEGYITTKEAAMDWERRNGCNKNWQ